MSFWKWYLTLGSFYEIKRPKFDAPRTRFRDGPAGKTPESAAADEQPLKDQPPTYDAPDYAIKILKLLPAETSAVYAFCVANLIEGDEDFFGNLVTFGMCIVVTAIIRFPLLLLKNGRKQIGFYFIHLFVCILWLYSVGCYFFQFHPRDGQVASVLLFVTGIVFAYRYKGNEHSGLLD